MDPTQSAQPPTDPPPTAQPTPSPPPPQPQPQPQPQQQQLHSQPPPTPSPSSSVHPSAPPITSSSNPNPNPNPNPKTLTPLLQPESQPQQQQIQQIEQDQKQDQHDQQFSGFQSAQNRPALGRHWQQPSHLSHFQPHHLQGMPAPSTTSAASSPSTVPSPVVSAPPRGGTAIGVPAIRPGLAPQPNAFSSGFGYGGVPRNPANASEPLTNSGPATARPAMHAVPTMGMIGSQMQPGILPGTHQQRPAQLSYRPQASPVNQPSPSQNFQGQGIMRPSSAGSPSSGAPSTSHGQPPQNQAWLSSMSHGRPPTAIPPSRPPLNPQSLQQKSQMSSQPHHAMPPAPQQQLPPPQQQQPPTKSSNQQREHPGQQLSRNSIPQSSSSQQARIQGSANQKSSSVSMAQPGTVQTVTNDIAPAVEIDEANKRIIGKRSIQELITQIDPSEKLDPEVEDILIDIAEEFVESITTFGCSLAKHRRSTTLEAKDILLHLERNWNMTLPGFGGDEIKIYKKPLTNDIHRERLTVVRKSIAGAETGNAKVQPFVNAKGHLAKALPNASGP